MKRVRNAVVKSAKPRKSSAKTAGPVERQIDAYVQRKNVSLREVTDGLRQLVKKTVPESREVLNPWGLPTFAWRGALCLFMVSKNHVTFGFPRGTELPDPAHLLEGTGKSIRHVKLREKEQLLDANLRDLILSAVNLNRRDPRNSMLLPAAKAPKKAAARA
jgi:hypothetical protein